MWQHWFAKCGLTLCRVHIFEMCQLSHQWLWCAGGSLGDGSNSRTQNGSPGNNEGTLLGDPGTLLRKGHVPLMCSLILHMTHQHHLLCHDYEPTFILHLPPCVLHKTGGLVVPNQSGRGWCSVLSAPFRCLVEILTASQLCWEVSVHTSYRACLCVFPLWLPLLTDLVNVLNRVIGKSGCVSRCIAGVSVEHINR